MMAGADKWEKRRSGYIVKLAGQIEEAFNEAAREAARLGASLTGAAGDKAFSFSDHPGVKKRLDKLLDTLGSSITATVADGIRLSWALANEKNDALCGEVFGDAMDKMDKTTRDRYFTTNTKARDAFISRRESGLGLSDRVWNYTNQFREEIELGLDIGIRDGLSADELSRRLRQYLKYPDKLFRRVRDEHGTLRLSRAAKAFHPGRGVYRSSYKNARRLAATECNIAYRTADYTRWQQLDFVVGVLIEPSGTNHVPDICDELAGRYPKSFKWTGWHPHCRCHAIALLKTEEEMEEDNRRILGGGEPAGQSVNTVSDAPDCFTAWVDENRERAKGWSAMPYFVKDNREYAGGVTVDTYTAGERKFTQARHTGDAMREVLKRRLQEKYPDMENTELAAVYEYTRGDVPDFRRLNRQLMSGTLSEFNAAFSELLSSALSKLPAEEGTVYRTIRLNRTKLNEWKAIAETNSEVTFSGFTSASADLDTVLGLIQRRAVRKKGNETDILLVITGNTGRSIEGLSMFNGHTGGLPNQREVLFDRGAKLKFTSWREGALPVFYLEEI